MVDLTDLFSQRPETSADLYEYFFLISPPQHVQDEVRKLKHRLKWSVGLDDYNLHSPAHISLFKINDDAGAWSEKGGKRLSWPEMEPFTVRIDGHEVFRHGNKSRSLVLKIEDVKPIRDVFRALLPADAPHAAKMKPHITIARSVPVANIENIPDLSEYDLKTEFVCDTITVLRKRVYNPGKYEKHCEIGLEK